MADNYNVGNIFVNLETETKQLDGNLDKVIKDLKNLKKSLNGFSKINLDKVQANLTTISNLDFSRIENAFAPLKNVDTKTISSVNRQMKNIANLNLDKVDFKKLYGQFGTLTRIIEPFIQKIQKAEPSLKAFSNALDLGKINTQLLVAEARIKEINSRSQNRKVLDDVKIKKANVQLELAKKRLDDVNNKSNKTSKSFNKIFNFGKIYFWLNYTKRITQSLNKMVTSAISYEETSNKFQVSMGINYSKSLKFVNEITKAFNLSTESVMNYMSTFKNMLSALGNLDEDVSYQLSETLTRMAIDYASLFNISTERAMEQFQAVLSGQIRSIRSVSGYDVSETSLFSIYQSLGGTKSMRQLDQIEKRLLRIIAVQQQMSETKALGDFEKTINSTSNEIKQLSETIKEIGRWLGQLTMFFVEPFVERILAGAIALKELLKYLNIVRGYTEQKFDTTGFFGEQTEKTEEFTEAVENLKNSLLGFDKLNILGSSQGNENSDYSLLLNQITKYKRSLTEVQNKANEISKSILEWLGYTYDTEGNLEKVGNRLEKILVTVGSIIVALLGNAIFQKIASLVSGLGSLVGGKGILSLIKGKAVAIVGTVAILVTSFLDLYNNSEDFRKSLDSSFSNIGKNLKQIFDFINKEVIPVVKPFLDFLWKFLGETVGFAINKFIKRLEFITKLLTGDFKGAFEVIKSFIDDIDKMIGRILGENTWKNFKTLIELTISEIGEFINNIVKNVQNAFNNIKTIFKSLINIVIASFNKVIRGLNKISFDFPDWIPGIGGNSFGINIPEIPMLANGGVIDKPTMAMVGEYAGAKSNPEIVSPENKLREVFLESMLPIAQMIVNGNKQVVEAIKETGNRPITLNGRKVSESIYSDLMEVALRKGTI